MSPLQLIKGRYFSRKIGRKLPAAEENAAVLQHITPHLDQYVSNFHIETPNKYEQGAIDIALRQFID